MALTTLASAVTADGNSTAVQIPFRDGKPRKFNFFLTGVPNGATVKLQTSHNGTTDWRDIPSASLTAVNTYFTVNDPLEYIRSVQSGSGASTNLNHYIQ